MILEQVFVTSINKAINRAKVTGTFNLLILSIAELYIYYINYTDFLISIGLDFKEKNKQLKEAYLKLKYKYPSIICNYKSITPTGGNVPVIVTPNTAPTVDSFCVDMLSADDYQFTVGDFTTNYTDAEGHPYKYLLIYPITTPVDGNLYISGSLSGIQGTLQIDKPVPSKFLNNAIIFNIEDAMPTDLLALQFRRTNALAFGNNNFTFRVSDNPSDYLYSTLQTGCVSSTLATTENQPPADIGDRTVYVDNRAVTVFTLYDFTGGLQAPYNDPEGDFIDAICIIDISNANIGKFYVNGVEIYEGQIITREEINAGTFTHEAPDTDAINSDVFEFKARDEGSQIWVE